MTDPHTAKARELFDRWGWALPQIDELAAVLREAAAVDRERIREHLRNALYTERDPKAPGVWMFCRYRDEDGDELLKEDRLFPRHADAQKQIDAFVSALFETIDMGHPERQPVVLARGEVAK